MTALNCSNSLKKLVCYMGVAGASVLLSVPARAQSHHSLNVSLIPLRDQVDSGQAYLQSQPLLAQSTPSNDSSPSGAQTPSPPATQEPISPSDQTSPNPPAQGSGSTPTTTPGSMTSPTNTAPQTPNSPSAPLNQSSSRAEYLDANPPTEVPSPSLYYLDRGSATEPSRTFSEY